MFSTGAWSDRNIDATPSGSELVTGVMLRGINLVPKAAHITAGNAYRNLFAEWDWAGWIKPQIDAGHSIGCNLVRLIGDLEGVNDGTFTQSYYDAKWAQLITYADSLDMYAYPAGGGPTQVASAGLTTAQIGSTVAAAAAAWDDHANVIGIDILQESVRAFPSNSYVMPDPAVVFDPVAAVTTKPLTCSSALNDAVRGASPAWRMILDPYVDFWDIHLYFAPPPDYLFQIFWSKGVTKPVLIGEFGLPSSSGAAAQTARFEAVKALMERNYYGIRPAGSLAWAAFDQEDGADPAGAYGIFESDGSPRTWMTDVFEAFPTS